MIYERFQTTTKTMKYTLHPNLSLIRANEIKRHKTVLRFSDAIIQQIEAEQMFLLANERLDAVFVINPSIKRFLQAFSLKSRSFDDVLTELANEVNCPTADIQETLQTFFDNMTDREILVSQRAVPKILRLKQQQITALLHSGDILDNDFEILGPLSINGFLQVFLAKNSKTGDKVVLKLLSLPTDININKSNKAYAIKNFRQEFDLMSEFKGHPHICQLLEIRETTPLFAVLEHIEGESLRRIIDTKILSFKEKCHLAKQVAASVAVLHQKKVLHGDLHLNNFLVNSTNFHVKLIDFDLANHAQPKRGEIVHEGGIHEYIAPEKINPNSFDLIEERADYRSEVFQLGIILYAIFFGKRPFEALTWQELTEKIRFSEPSFAADMLVPMPIIHLIQKSLAKNPKHRFGNAVLLHKALTRPLSMTAAHD